MRIRDDGLLGVNIPFHLQHVKLTLPNHMLKLTMAMILVWLLAACATTVRTVRQQDLDAWVGVPVEALDTHPFFMKVPMFRTRTDSGTEILNYAYGYNFGECFRNAGATRVGDFVSGNAFTTCSSSRIVCNSIFYSKEGKVIEYAPTGRCYTDETLQPEGRYLSLRGQ